MKKWKFLLCLILLLCMTIGFSLSVHADGIQAEIFSMAMELPDADTVTAELQTAVDGTVIAGLYSEENALLAVGTAEVTGKEGTQSAVVELPEGAPSFHHAKVFLVDRASCTPLCDSLTKTQTQQRDEDDIRTGVGAKPVTVENGTMVGEIVLTAGATTVEVPDGTRLAADAAELTVTITAAEAPAILQMTKEATITNVAYEIQVEGLADQNSSLLQVSMQVPSNLEDIRIYHYEKEMTKIETEAAAADGTFLYDATSGNVTIWTTSFSPFTLSFKTYDGWREHFHEHRDTDMTYGYALVVNGAASQRGTGYEADLVDLTGTVHEDVKVSKALHDVAQAANGDVLVRYEIDDHAEMGNVQLAATAADGTVVGGGGYALGSEYMTAKTRILICKTLLDGTVYYEAVTGYLNLDTRYTAGTNAVVQYIVSENLVDCVVIREVETSQESAAPDHFLLLGSENNPAFIPAILPGFENYSAYQALVGDQIAILLMPAAMPMDLGCLYEDALLTYEGLVDGLPVYSCEGARSYVDSLVELSEISDQMLITGEGTIMRLSEAVGIWALIPRMESGWDAIQIDAAAALLPCSAYVIEAADGSVAAIYLLAK